MSAPRPWPGGLTGALPPGGGGGNPILIPDLKLSFDEDGLQPLEGDCIARGQTFYIWTRDVGTTPPPLEHPGIVDWDGIGDPDPGYDEIKWVKWYRRIRPLDGEWGPWTLEKEDNDPAQVDNNHYTSFFKEDDPDVIDTDCDVEYKAVADDEGTITDDDEVFKTSAPVTIIAVDYVVVRPNSNPEIIDLSQQNSKGFTGYAYSLGGDELRSYDELGNPIPGRESDVQINALFDWTFSAPELLMFNGLNPAEGCVSTTMTATRTGKGTLTATYTDDILGLSVSGSAAVRIVNGGYFIDLVGVNFDEVQNLPINGKLPASKDGFNAVGRVKGKVEITGDPNTDYTVNVRDIFPYQRPQIDIIGGSFGGMGMELTTNGDGYAEHEFEIRDDGGIPSTSLENVRIEAELIPPGGGDRVARTEECITVYEFYFRSPPEIIATSGGMSSTGDPKQNEDGFQCWTGSDTSHVLCYSRMWKRAKLQVLCEPTGAFSGTVLAAAEAEFHRWCHATIIKGHEESGLFGGELGLTISDPTGIVSLTWTPSGSRNRAGVAMDMSVEFDDGLVRERGEWPWDSSEVYAGYICPPWGVDEKDHDDAMIEYDEPRLYEIGGAGHEVRLGIEIAASTTLEFFVLGEKGYGATVISDGLWDLEEGESYIDSKERASEGIDVRGHGGLYEIQ